MNEKEIQEHILNNGYECYEIGGCVRNRLWNLPVTDIDLVTNATPEELGDIFEGMASTCSCGNTFLVTIIDGIEVSTYRKDKADHAEVARTLKEDVIRRDFTINALAEDKHGYIIDLVDGIQDAKNKILRAIGKPIERFIEDPVRILRGLRFASIYNLEISENTKRDMQLAITLLDEVPMERFKLEMKKAFSSTQAYKFVNYLLELGIFYNYFPSLKKLIKDGGKYHGETVIEHALLTIKSLDDIGCTDWKLKISGLYHDIGKIYHDFDEDGNVHFKAHNLNGNTELVEDLSHLKLSQDEIDYVQCLKNCHMWSVKLDDDSINKKSVRKLKAELIQHEVDVKDWFILRYADKKSNLRRKPDECNWIIYRKRYREILDALKNHHVFSIKDLEINGLEIMKICNIKQGGPIVGKYLKTLYNAVMEEQVYNKKEYLIEYLINIKE